jgi:hypothetical protein
MAHADTCHALHTETAGNRASGRTIDVACIAPHRRPSTFESISKTYFCCAVPLTRKCFFETQRELVTSFFNLELNCKLCKSEERVTLKAVERRNSCRIFVRKSLENGDLEYREGDKSIIELVLWMFRKISTKLKQSNFNNMSDISTFECFLIHVDNKIC